MKLPPNMEMVAQKVATDGITDSTTFKSTWKLAILPYKSMSLHFTYEIGDFMEYQPIVTLIPIQTANNITYVTGLSTIIIPVLTDKGHPYIVHLYLIYHIPNITSQLLSMETFLLDDLMIHGNAKSISFLWNTGKEFLQFKLHLSRDSIYVVQSHTYEDTHVNLTIVYAVDYQTLHKHLAHSLCDVISHARKNTQNFLDITFPEKDPICLAALMARCLIVLFLQI